MTALMESLTLLHTTLTGWGFSPLNASTVMELLALAAIMVAARTLVWLVNTYAQPASPTWLSKRLANLVFPITAGLACWAAARWAPHPLMGGHILNGIAIIMTVWLVLRLARMLPGPRLLKFSLVSVVALGILLGSLHSLTPLVDLLNQMNFTLGGLTISLRTTLEALFFLGMFGWLSFASAEGLEHALERQEHISPALQTLMVKLFKLSALALGLLLALTVAGVNITHLAVFSGALGVGIGLSLKSIASNYLSGILLLLDKSIKPGDVISVDDTSFGQVKALHGRYIVLRRRDGKEVLIPNEMLMNQSVINWSYSNKAVRSDTLIGVAYESDMEQVQGILREAVKAIPRVLSVPAPVVFIKEFGDSSVVFQVRYWSNDPELGVGNLRGEVNMALWKALKDNDIHIPFPQRVVHMAPAPAAAKPVRKPRKRLA
ncbi:MAG: mechanosensitive ion channel [Pseudomonadaceae bacterium]|nr:mechanosensitive ion channel [Pseudomonadaceae bacterium]